VHYAYLFHSKAIYAYEKSIELKPGNADVLTDLGIMYRLDGNPLKAKETFDQAIFMDPKHENSRLNKGIVLIMGDRDGGIQTWEELLEINQLAMANDNQSVDQLLKHYKEGHDITPSN
jgi:lipoprotein NlpI